MWRTSLTGGMIPRRCRTRSSRRRGSGTGPGSGFRRRRIPLRKRCSGWRRRQGGCRTSSAWKRWRMPLSCGRFCGRPRSANWTTSMSTTTPQTAAASTSPYYTVPPGWNFWIQSRAIFLMRTLSWPRGIFSCACSDASDLPSCRSRQLPSCQVLLPPSFPA